MVICDPWKLRFDKINLTCTNTVAHFKIGPSQDISSKRKIIKLQATYELLKKQILIKITSEKYMKKNHMIKIWKRLQILLDEFLTMSLSVSRHPTSPY